IPLLLAVVTAHLVLIPVVELQRQLSFGLYFVAVIIVIVMAIAGFGIWRLGAIFLPIGSILAYGYFAFLGHQADVAGLIVKLVEVAVVAAAVTSLLRYGLSGPRRSPA
ncbi:MAG: hypothetical protein ACREOM_09710, partial [Candidatus Dormibacteraceae bacterium]